MRTRSILVVVLIAVAAPPLDARVPWDRSGIDWSQPPPLGPAPSFTPPRPKRLRLANGMALLVVENRRLPIVSMQLVVPGAGSAADPAGKAGLAAYTADLLDEGAGGLGALEISDRMDRLGASITVWAGRDHATVAVSGLTRTLDGTLDLFTKIVTAPAFDPEEGKRVHADRLTDVKLRADRPGDVASVAFYAALYGQGTPYGHPDDGLAADLESITVEEARAFYRDRWRPERMTLVVAGDVSAEALRAKLDAGLGAWNPPATGASASADPPAITPATPPARVLWVDRPGAAQSNVRIGLVGLPRSDARYYAAEVYSTAVGGTFLSRLNRRLREELGYTYGIRAGQAWARAPGPFVVRSEIFTRVTADGLKETLRILAEMTTTELPAAELRKTKDNLIRGLPEQFESNAGAVEAFADLALHGLPDDWYEGYAARIEAVTAADVRAVAAAVYDPARMTIVVVGDLAEVGPALGPLGLGAPVRVDVEGRPIK